MWFIKRFDPAAGMGGDEITDLNAPGVVSSFEDLIEAEVSWVQQLATDPNAEQDGDVPARVTVNTDNATSPSVWFIHWHYLDGQPDQTDYIFLIRDDDPEEDDVSVIGGAQCRDCGRVNVQADDETLIVPVWRQAADGAHLLCDECADKEGAR